MATPLPIPPCIHVEMLEEWLLLQAFRKLWYLEGHESMPPSLAMLVRNDLIHWASHSLSAEGYAIFLEYAAQLEAAICTHRPVCFPRPVILIQDAAPAEQLALHFLQQKHGALWSALRQVAALLPFEMGKRAVGRHRYFSVGAYGHRCHVGLLKHTHEFPAVCQLANALITKLHPAHVWTTITFNVNLEAGVHADTSNAAFDSLLVGISHYDLGELWLAEDGGTVYQEHKGQMVPGRAYHTSGQALLFKANATPHAVLPWTTGDRFTMVAHTIGQYAHLADDAYEKLLCLGFGLPCGPSPEYPFPHLG